MKNLKVSLVVLITAFTFYSCSNNNSPEDEVLIRLSNVSAYDYKTIKVNNTSFGNVNQGEKSEYKVFKLAYRYGFVELEIDGSTYTIQPIDYVGETPLGSGKYTYQIDANDSQEQYGKLSLEFIVD